MKSKLSFLLLCLMLWACSKAGNRIGISPTGIADLDRIRAEALETMTTKENALSRRAALYRWWKFLWRQGMDMSGFDDAARELLTYDDDSPRALKAIDEGYRMMEFLFSEGKHIEEIKAQIGEQGSKTNWPFFHGTDGSQSGYSPDNGPSAGKIAWKFPKGYSWTARPLVEKGKVYLSSPGIDVVGYCLDLETGHVVWNARQYGTDFYKTSGSRTDPVPSPDRIMFRTGKSNLIFDRKTGKRLVPEDDDFKAETSGSYYAYQHYGRSIMLIDAGTGAGIRQYRFPAELSGEPTMDGNDIYAAQKNGKLYRYSTSSKEPVWESETFSEIRGSLSYGTGKLYAGTADGKIIALDKESGGILWTFRADKKENHCYRYLSGVVESGGRIYFGSADSFLYCVDSENGMLLWKLECSDWIRSSPHVRGNTVIACALDGEIFAIRDDGQGATVLWKKQVSEHGFVADLAGNEDVVLASGRDLILYAISTSEGKLLWKHGIVDGAWVDGNFHAADWIGGLQSSPTVVDGIVYAGGPDGFLNAVDSESGKEIWRYETVSTISLAPTVADGKVFFGSLGEPGLYYALDKDSGDPVWITGGIRGAWCGAAYSAGRIFAGCMDGKMRAADAATGEILWVYDAGFSHPSSGELFGIYSNTAFDSRNIYFGSWAGYYEALDQVTGKLVWKTKTCYDFTRDRKPDSSAPVLWKNHLYVQKMVNTVAAINIYTGEIENEWMMPEDRFQNGTVAAFGDKIFASASLGREIIPYESSIFAFSDLENGAELRWKAKGGGGLTAPVGTSDKLICPSSADVFMTCFDPENGDILWRCYTGGVMGESVPAIYGNRVFAQFRNGWLLAIE